MFHRVTDRPLRVLVLRVDFHPPLAYYRVRGGDDLRVEEGVLKKREREGGRFFFFFYLESSEIGVKGVDGRLPGCGGAFAGVEDGGGDQGAVAVLGPVDPVHGEHYGHGVHGRVVVPGQGEVQVEGLAASHDKPRAVPSPAHRLVPRRSVVRPVLADARVHVQDREHRHAQVLPCDRNYEARVFLVLGSMSVV